ncbi:unnamed protein product [Periconia digitata]|uniref:Uncharacterized protein n=1 Tax=Periconia digitata TaxID=1303443 RepID=A0A9W4XQJ0_9PLEO|nr:unnamed protein product [Periconia digitata]
MMGLMPQRFGNLFDNLRGESENCFPWKDYRNRASPQGLYCHSLESRILFLKENTSSSLLWNRIPNHQTDQHDPQMRTGELRNQATTESSFNGLQAVYMRRYHTQTFQRWTFQALPQDMARLHLRSICLANPCAHTHMTFPQKKTLCPDSD